MVVISLDELREKVRKDTILVSIMHVNNEMGAIQPIDRSRQKLFMQKVARSSMSMRYKALGKLPVLFNGEAGPDIVSISGHKIHGLKGSGIIAFRKMIQMKPFIVGGGQEFGLRSGTVAVPQAVALAKAARLAVENMTVAYRKL